MPFADDPLTVRTNDSDSLGGGPSAIEPPTVQGKPTWGDVLSAGEAGTRSVMGTGAGFLASLANEPSIEQEWRRNAEHQKQLAQQDIQEMTPAGQQAREGSFFRHPLVVGAEAAPGLVALAAPAIAAAPIAPIAGPLVAGGVMGAQARGDFYNRTTEQGIEPTSGQLAGAQALGTAIGLATEPMGAFVGKIAVSPLIKRVLGATGDAVIFGPGMGAQELTSQQAEIAGGKRSELDTGAIGGAMVSGAEMGAGFGAVFSRGHTHETGIQSGGESSVKRTKDIPYQRPEAALQTPPGATPSGTGPAPPAPKVDPAQQAALDAAQGKTTPRVVEPQPAPVVQPEVAQPPPGGATRATEPPPAASTTGPPSPPQPPPGPQPATAAGPGPTASIPEPDATLRAQHDALLDPSNPREAMIYAKDVQPIELIDVTRYGQTKLKDGRIVQYDKLGPSALTPKKIGAYARSDRLNKLLQMGDVSQTQAVEQSVAGVGEPAVVVERAPDGTERKLAETTTAAADATAGEMEATKTPGSTVGLETQEGAAADRFAKAREENIARQQAERVQAEIAARKAEMDDAERGIFKPEQPRQETPEAAPTGAPATPRVEPTGRVLEAKETGRERLARQRADAKQAKTVENLLKEKETERKTGTKKRGEKAEINIAETNRLADEIVKAHPAPPVLDNVKRPTEIYKRALAMVEAAKKAKIEIPDEFREGHPYNSAMLKLREAADLTKTKEPKWPAYARFMDREKLLDEGRQKEAEAVRRNEGAQGLGSPEGVAEVRPTGETREVTPEEELINKQEAAHEAVAEQTDEAPILEAPEKPVEKEKLTEQQRLRQEANERVRAKLAGEVQEKVAVVEGKTRPTEGEGRAEAPAPRAAVGFKTVALKSRAIKKPTLEESRGELTADERKELHDAGWTDDEISGYTPEEARIKLAEEREFIAAHEKAKQERDANAIEIEGNHGKEIVHPSEVETAAEAIKKTFSEGRYAAGAPQMMGKLRDLIVKIAGDTPVYYISGKEMERLTGHSDTIGAYSGKEKLIVINRDRHRGDVALHETFHAAVDLSIKSHPELRDLVERLRVEVLQKLPSLTKTERDEIGYFLTKDIEFLNGMMTNWRMQEFLKSIKISKELAEAIGIPKWRKMTMWEGALSIIRQAMGLTPRETSAIEAAMSLTEQAIWRDKRGTGELMAAVGRMANKQMDEGLSLQRGAPERDQEAYLKTPSETLSKIKNIDRVVATQHMKDMAGNAKSTLTRVHAKLLSGTWMNDIHGHLFEDAKGQILKAINIARDRVAQTYHEMRELDRDIMARGYLLDAKYASSMKDYGRLLAMSVAYNIHADRALPKVEPVGKAARKNWQRDKYGPEVQALYDKMPEELQKRYTAEKKFYADKQAEMARSVIEKSLPLFDPPKGRTLEEVMKLALENKLEDTDLAHYEEAGASRILDRAYRLLNKKDVYFYGDRSGDHVVTGHYEMPAGGKSTSHSGESLPENTREFDTEAQAHAYETGTHLPADTREAYYVKDKIGYTDVYPDTPETRAAKIVGKKVRAEDADLTKYRVSLETQDTRFADTHAEAVRNRAAMEAAGVQKLSGVLNKHDERAWSQINSADQKALERRLASRDDITPTEKQHIRDATRQMMLMGKVPHFMERRDVAGANHGTADALDTYSRNINQYLARTQHSAALEDAMDRLDKHDTAMEGDVANSDRRSAIANEMRNRVYKDPNMLTAKISPLMQKLYTLTFINYLARPSFVFLSQLHPWLYSVPMMAGRHGMWKAAVGQRQATSDLGGQLANLGRGGKASFDVFRSLFEKDTDKAVALAHGHDAVKWMINNLKDKDEKAFLTELNKDARFQTAFDASMFSGKGMDRTNYMMQQFTHAMEATNRLSSALNAYRLEKAMHKDHAGATAYANRMIEESHGVYSSTNIAPVLRSPLMRPFMQFHNQPMNLAMMLYRNGIKAFGKGEAAEEARWTLAYQLGTAMALGGMGGMPMDIPRMVANATAPATGMGSADYADEAQRGLSELLGQTTANAIMQGLPGMMGPYGPSLGGRIGYDIGFFTESLKSGKPDDIYAMIGKAAAGAPGSMVMDWLSAAQAIEKGDFQTASEKAMPGFLKDIAKSYRLATTGKYAGQQQIRPASVADAMRQLTGFAGAEEQRQTTGHYALQRALQAESKGKSEILTQFAQRKANQGDIAKWNHANPKNRITPQETQAARHPGKTTLGVKVTPKNRALAREYGSAYQ